MLLHKGSSLTQVCIQVTKKHCQSFIKSARQRHLSLETIRERERKEHDGEEDTGDTEKLG